MRISKVIKSVIALAVLCCVLFTLSTVSLAAYFPDVPLTLSDEYKDSINYISDNGIINGLTPSTFSPFTNMNRAMFVTALYRMSGDTGSYNGSSYYSDVPSNSYYNAAVGWAHDNNITYGTTNTLFSPTDPINKSQTVVFLKRYAHHMGYNDTDTEDITGAFDYTMVPNYARSAMSWAFSFGIITYSQPTGGSGYIYPLETVTRADGTVYLCRFIHNVRGFLKEYDAFSFGNNSSSFVTGANLPIYMSSNDRALMLNINPDLGSSGTFIGYCFGMSVSCLLDFYGKIDLNGNFCNSIATVNSIHKPSTLDSTHILTSDYLYNTITISEVESKIAMYQNAQFLSPISAATAPYYCPSLTTGLQEMVTALEHGGAGILSFFYGQNSNTSAHAIVVYGKPIAISNGYKLNVYDNSWRNYTTWLEINTNSNNSPSPESAEWSVVFKMQSQSGGTIFTRYSTIQECKFQNDLSYFSALDTDGWYNSEPNISQIPENRALVELTVSGNFTLKNSDGDKLSFEYGNLTGAMDVYYYDFLPSAPGSPVRVRILVDSSESFECSERIENAISELSIKQDEKQVCATTFNSNTKDIMILNLTDNCN